MATYYSKVLKFDLDAPAYPNAEVLHRLMVNILPPMSIALVPHDTFGMDLSPGLLILLDSAFVPDVMEIESLNSTALKVFGKSMPVWSASIVCVDIANGAVINVRPGCIAPDKSYSTGVTVRFADILGMFFFTILF